MLPLIMIVTRAAITTSQVARLTPDSIPVMSKPQATKYSIAIDKAMDRTNTANVDAAALMGVGESFVSHWRSGRRPVPAKRAPALAELLGLKPEEISPAYERLVDAGVVADDSLTPPAPSGVVPAGHRVVAHLQGFSRPQEVPPQLVMPEFVLSKLAGLVPLHRLRWIVAPTRNMEPTISRGDLVLIDCAPIRHEEVHDGGTYAYTLWGRPDLRRIFVRKDHWSLAGATKGSDYIDVDDDDLDNLVILGQVIGNL